MEIYQCLTIGINRYQYLRPLSYGIADAQALYQVLCQQIKVPPQSLCVLSDPTYPGRQKILDALDTLSPTFCLWFFFSGYAMQHAGEDYLLPIDGNPAHPEKTGIKIGTVFDKLQRTNAEHILVILDLHRISFNSIPPGTTAIALAKNLGLTLILSSAIEPSHPKISHPQGILTTALTEALRHYQHQLTLNLLEQYFQTRLPELNHIQSLNQQTPVIVSPSLKMRSQPLFPEVEEETVRLREKEAEIGGKPKTASLTLPKLPTPPVEPVNRVAPAEDTAPVNLVRSTSKVQFKRFNLVLWGISAFICGVLLWEWRSQEESPISDRSSPGTMVLADQQASRFHNAIVEAGKVKPDNPAYDSARAEIKRWSRVIFDIATGRAEKGDYRSAIAAAELIPKGDSALYTLATDSMKIWREALKQQKINLVLLEAAEGLRSPDQATSYLQAITVLEQIPTGSKEYEQARALIERWSDNIYGLAVKQAKINNFSRAIKIAALIPPSTRAYSKAEKSIERWRKR